MISQGTHHSLLLPISSAVQLHMTHIYAHHFHEVANAFLLKYNVESRFCYTTIASSRQLDEDSFEIVRRMENTFSSRPVYERIIFNRGEQTVRGYTFEDDEAKAYVEGYVYKGGNGPDSGKTLYDMFLYKNPGLKKMLRFKLHNWGVQTMEGIIKKEAELKEALRERREQLMEAKEHLLEAKEKMISETTEKLKEKISEIKATAAVAKKTIVGKDDKRD